MIQWIHAGVGVLTLLVLSIFLIVYVGVFSSVTTRLCGAPLPGVDGNKGEKGDPGIALFPGKTGPQGTVPGRDGPQGPTALGILTGPQPPPSQTGIFSGPTGISGWRGPDGPLLDPKLPAPPINFAVDNNGFGTPLDQYQDTGFFSITIMSNAAAPSTAKAQARFVRIGKIVCFEVLQLQMTHGGALDDWINFLPAEFMSNAPAPTYFDRFFFHVSSIATTPYVMEQHVMVYDKDPSLWTEGLFHLQISPAGTTGTITAMRLQYRALYATEADSGTSSFSAEAGSKFPAASTGTFGLTSDIAIIWTLV